MAGTGEGLGLFFAKLLHPPADRVGTDSQFLRNLGLGLACLMDSTDQFKLELAGKSAAS